MLTAFAINTLLISVRLTPLIVAAPVAFFARVPLMVRMLLALTLAAVMAGALPERAVELSPAVIAGELLVGVVMAFGFHAAHAALDFLGKLVDTQIGLNAAGVFDPGTSNVTGIIAEFLVLAFAMLFIALNQHHELLRAFSGLLTVVPPGSVSLAVLSIPLVQILTQQFLLALMIVAPVVVTLWLVDIAFAFMARSMPQANVYFLALPVKLSLGALVLLLSLPLVVQRIPLLFERALGFGASIPGAP
ncbi:MULTISPECIES: flagellar biosynthetic protein FliR [unclassified Pseudomonas]|uniref:flagellar biosynthetic protein FliR n=1 Tax=unclassified Pseudomonas TaxID=196821 RepID=UPI00244B73B1|nr:MULTISPECIES: flagellar biosynthetic protein FliR [unclassified Pseudomonas]MDG9930374.1 flagellar biosynthetic protein FliR [Pseudomonas sp. GD04042]MDH0484513.1 flagellar biosynthetic protein FliR [Pseudomonas sp. GD04015]MDH0606029.1 flagellar biosynthetic protein FliR [Pseudomonas sp. GD03869]